MLRDRPLCVACQREGRTTVATEVDHIRPLHLGGTDAHANLQPLCDAHHTEKTQRESNDRR